MFIFDLNLRLAYFIQPYLNDISLALIATVLVICGGRINSFLKKSVSTWIFIARVSVFILMCTFGYGLLTLWGQMLIYWLITHIDLVYRPIVIFGCFCLLGIVAERKRYL